MTNLVAVDYSQPAIWLGLGLIGGGLSLYQLRSVQPRLSRDFDVVVSSVVIFSGGILIFQVSSSTTVWHMQCKHCFPEVRCHLRVSRPQDPLSAKFALHSSTQCAAHCCFKRCHQPRICKTQGWRLDPLLLFCQLLTAGTALAWALEAIKLRRMVDNGQVSPPLFECKPCCVKRYRAVTRRERQDTASAICRNVS